MESVQSFYSTFSRHLADEPEATEPLSCSFEALYSDEMVDHEHSVAVAQRSQRITSVLPPPPQPCGVAKSQKKVGGSTVPELVLKGSSDLKVKEWKAEVVKLAMKQLDMPQEVCDVLGINITGPRKTIRHSRQGSGHKVAKVLTDFAN